MYHGEGSFMEALIPTPCGEAPYMVLLTSYGEPMHPTWRRTPYPFTLVMVPPLISVTRPITS